MKHNYLIVIILSILTIVSCKMVQDTEGWDIKSKNNADNIIFKTNNKFTYNTYRIKDKDTLDCFVVHLNDTIVIKKVVLTVLPGKFFSQTKMKWEYFDENDSIIKKSISGVVEDQNTIWLHPPRSGMPFIYTESAPFPEIKFPLDSIQNWRAGLGGLKGFESIGLEGTVKFEYTVVEKEGIQTDFKFFENCWVINSKGESSIGTSTHTYYFNEEHGFVYSEYNFPTGEKLVLSISDYKEGKTITNVK